MSSRPTQRSSWIQGNPQSSQSQTYTPLGSSRDLSSRYPPNQQNQYSTLSANSPRKSIWKNPWIKYGIPLLLIVAIAAGVGGGVAGSHHSSNKSTSLGATSGSSSSGSSSSISSSKGSSTTARVTSTATSTSATPSISVTPLAKFNFETTTMYGMCVGNWLILERWMNDQWFQDYGGADAYDEWTFTLNLGNETARSILSNHWETWFTDDDVELLHQYGYNTLRLPIGFWALIPTVEGEPYLNMAGQMDNFERIMESCYKRGMYIEFDLHGLPGSQNGEQESGHNTTNPTFFTDANQNRSDDTVAAALTFIANSPYRSVISSIGICNEPRPYTDAQFTMLADFYARSYDAIQASAYPVPMIFHHGFPSTQSHLSYWLFFVEPRVTSPPSLLIEDHPYPGNFPPITDTTEIITETCNDGGGYYGYPIPVAITEWSVYTGVTDGAFTAEFYDVQTAVWAWGAGGTYWAYKLNQTIVGDANYTQYSWVHLEAAGLIAKPTSTSQSTNDFVASFSDGSCGAKPTVITGNWTGVTVTSSAWAGETIGTKKRSGIWVPRT